MSGEDSWAACHLLNRVWGRVGWTKGWGKTAATCSTPLSSPPVLIQRHNLTVYQVRWCPGLGWWEVEGTNPAPCLPTSPLPRTGWVWDILKLWTNIAPVLAQNGCRLGLSTPQFSHQ